MQETRTDIARPGGITDSHATITLAHLPIRHLPGSIASYCHFQLSGPGEGVPES